MQTETQVLPPVSALLYNTTWLPAYVHHTTIAGTWTEAPGTLLHATPAHFTAFPAGNWAVGLVAGVAFTFALTNGEGAWDNHGGSNYSIGA